MKTKNPAVGVGLLVASLITASPGYPQASQTSPPREYSAKFEQDSNWATSAVRAAKGMVVSDESLASAAGVKILKHGGNAVDAAVAVGFALAVVEPEAGNIGGGGFMLVRLNDGQSHFVDYRETAPAKASRDMYAQAGVDKDASVVGWKSVAVPGTVAGLALALKTYGTKNLAEVMAPAIDLAAKGFPVDQRLAALLQDESSTLGRFPTTKRIFLGGASSKQGQIFRQPELAATLRRIAKKGASDFYVGKTAQDLAGEMQREGGLITLDDLANYRPKIREPLLASYKSRGHDWQVITSPPPSSGGVAVIEELNILSPVELKGWHDASSVHWVIEAMRRAFADRAEFLADADFAKIPVPGLTSTCYADALRKSIDPERASDSKMVKPGNPFRYEAQPGANGECPQTAQNGNASDGESAVQTALREAARGGHTTHFSVVDATGNAVANTYTLNDNFGSGVTSSNGFFLNDEMDDFTAHPGTPNMFGLTQSEANTIAPGKRPLSSMMPTILLRDGKLSFVIGSPGGPTIISAALLSILNWMRLGMDAQAAINAPRFHQQWLPDFVALEPIFPNAVAKDLESRGFKLFPAREWIGQVEAIGIEADTGQRLGAADQRRKGSAIGY